MNTKAYIVLANGQVFEGKSFGATGCVTGEVVFTTGMTGYLETLTDPSNYGQIVLQTFPLAGDYGIIRKDAESSKAHAVGFVVREWCSTPSNFRCEETLDQYLKEQGVIGVYDVDTRALTKILRDNGTMHARIVSFSGDAEKDMEAVQALNSIMHDLVLNPSLGNHARKIRLLEEIKEHKLENPVGKVSRSAASLQQENKAVFDAAAEYGAVPVDSNGLKFSSYEAAAAMAGGAKVVLWDFGARASLTQELQKRGVEVVAVDAATTCQEILAMKPDGVVLSTGPGNPADYESIVDEISQLCNSFIPMLGIGLGHQLLAISQGARTEKLPYGHRGESHPVKNLSTGKVLITSQNCGYTVVKDSLPTSAVQTFESVNDKTCEGIQYRSFLGTSVQFYPKTSGGRQDTGFVYDQFVDMVVMRHQSQLAENQD